VKLLYDIAQALLQNVRIDFGRRDIGVSEHRLDTPQIRAAFQKMRGKAVTKHVRCQAVPNPDLFAILFQQPPKMLARETAAPVGHE
jgi:hypothetical protein